MYFLANIHEGTIRYWTGDNTMTRDPGKAAMFPTRLECLNAADEQIHPSFRRTPQGLPDWARAFTKPELDSYLNDTLYKYGKRAENIRLSILGLKLGA